MAETFQEANIESFRNAFFRNAKKFGINPVYTSINRNSNIRHFYQIIINAFLASSCNFNFFSKDIKTFTILRNYPLIIRHFLALIPIILFFGNTKNFLVTPIYSSIICYSVYASTIRHRTTHRLYEVRAENRVRVYWLPVN